jgi:hypothetical protein
MTAREGRTEIAGQLAQTGTPPLWIIDYLKTCFRQATGAFACFPELVSGSLLRLKNYLSRQRQTVVPIKSGRRSLSNGWGRDPNPG